jgi:hypothetical protein
VTLEEIGRQGSLPIVAPVKPYTEFALIYNPTTVKDEMALHSSDPTNLQGKLSTVKHRALEWIGFLLQIGFSSLTRRDQIL